MQAAFDESIPSPSQKLEDLEQIAQILSVSDYTSHVKNYTNFFTYFKNRGYKKTQPQQWDQLLSNFDFMDDPKDSRTILVYELTLAYRLSHPRRTSPPNFFTLLYFTIHSIHTNRSTQISVCQTMHQLILAQKNAIQHSFQPHFRLLQNSNTQNTSPLDPDFPVLTCSNNRWLAILGFAMIGLSTVLNLNPQFALSLGISLSPAMFVILVVVGAIFAGYGISRKEPDLPPAGRSKDQRYSCSQTITNYTRFCWHFFQNSHSSLPTDNPLSNSSTMER